MFNPARIAQNPLDDQVALDFVFQDCPPDRLDWAMSTRIMFYAKRAIEEPCPLRAWPRVPPAYIVCADDRTIAPTSQRNAAQATRRLEPSESPGGYCPAVSSRAAL